MMGLAFRKQIWSSSVGLASLAAVFSTTAIGGHAFAQATSVPAPITAAPVPAPSAPPAAKTEAPALIPAPALPAQPAIPGTAASVPPATLAAPVTPPVAAALKPKRKVPIAPPRETALSTDPNPTLTPETFFATAKASERYAAIADAGGWPVIEGPLSPSSKGRPVSTLRLRLAIEGDLNAVGHSGAGVNPQESPSMFDTRWTPDLTSAVKRFQIRHGLKDNGVVAGATLKALNVSARTRFTELASSAQRLAGRNFSFPERYVVVNLPSASVEAVENGQVVHRYVAVVGNAEHASPEVDAKVVAVNLNPTWTVPTSIIKNEIIPKMQRDPGYLAREKIRVLDNAGNTVNPASIDWKSQRAVNYTLRQDSGKANSLGSIRINMPNKYAVYMHDTPAKHLFGGDYRFLSHGCVRVQGVYDLAAWLLRDSLGAPDGLWSREAIEARIADGQHEEVRLKQAVPVSWVYLTGWANGDGVANFRDDVYGIDTVGAPAEARADPAVVPSN
ncbi:L,D-transpeptidase family protein [Lichenihabitans psoromatis]|uniref:L,D-transpeptidase family protein n=1 Tax=Lichenihabitans psoromatis TaxID=2528642 RepID=UPI001A93DC4B|nr:L,D-transpeptidase family protein [Lichenihabitans psoromatis]